MKIFQKFPEKTWLIFSILTLSITLFSIKCGSASDGNDRIGFPFPFYEYFGGKRSIPMENRRSFHAIYLFFNLLIYFGLAYFFSILIKKNKK